MTEPINIPATGTAAIHLFAINLDDSKLKQFADSDALLTHILGHIPDRPEQAEIIRLKDIEEIGLTEYLREGPGIDDVVLAPHRSRLDALEGHVLILYPGAFASDTVLAPTPTATFIAQLDRDPPDWTDKQTLHSEAATTPAPPAGRKRPSDAAMSGRIAMVALILLGLLTWLMILIA